MTGKRQQAEVDYDEARRSRRVIAAYRSVIDPCGTTASDRRPDYGRKLKDFKEGLEK